MLHVIGGYLFMDKQIMDDEIDPFELNEDDFGSDIETICLNCGFTEKVPDFIYDEMSRKKYHLKINKKVSTLYCSKCQKETAIPKTFLN